MLFCFTLLILTHFSGGLEKGAYVLCRVFHKNNIGPPNGQRYAPFIEEEWDDSSAMIPGAEPVSEPTAFRLPLVEGNGHVGCFERTHAVQVCSLLENFSVYNVV